MNVKFINLLKYLMVFCVSLGSTTLLGQQSKLVPFQTKIWETGEFSNLNATFSASNNYTTSTSTPQLIDNSETTGASLNISTNSTNTNAVATYVLTDNNTYDIGNFIELSLTSLINAVTLIGNLSYTIETSLDNVTYVPVLKANTTEQFVSLYNYNHKVSGFAAANYKYVRIKVTLEGATWVDRRATLTLQSIKKHRAGTTHLAITKNTKTPLVLPYFDIEIDENRTGWLAGVGLPIGSIVGNKENVIDANLNNSGNMFSGISVSLGMKAGIGVKKLTGTYPANTYLGYKVSLAQVLNVDLGAGFEIVTYLGNVEQERISGLNTILGVGLLSATSNIDLGLVTTKPADAFQITYTSTGASIGGITVHHPIVARYEEPINPILCGQMGTLTIPENPLDYNYNVEASVAINVANDIGVSNLANIFNADTASYASIYSTVGVSVATTKYINVFKVLSKFKKDNYYGFEIMYPSTLALDLLGDTKLFFINDGQKVDSATSAELLALNTSLLTGNGKTKIGFLAKQDFDQVQLAMEVPVGVSALGAIRIYDFIQQSFCEGPVLSCDSVNYANKLVPMTYPEFPVYVNGQFTGVSGGVSLGAGIENPNAAIDTIPDNYTTIDATLLALGQLTYTISDAITVHPPNTYVAFDITTKKLLNVDVLGGMKMRLVKNGQLLNTIYTPSLLAGVSVLEVDSQRYKFGIIASDSFDGVQLIIGDGVANIGLLGTIRVNGLLIEKLCEVDLACNESISLKQGASPVIINNARTGPQGLAGINLFSSSIGSIDNIIDEVDTNYTTVTGSVLVGSSNSIAVLNPIQTYPAGSNVGFVVEPGPSLLNIGLVNGITITTYNNGQQQESASSSYLLNLDALALNLAGTPSSSRYVGFRTSKPYDEVVITLGGLLDIDLDLNGTKIYSAVVNTNGVQFLNGDLCSNILPDMNVAVKNQLATGNLRTNDVFNSSITSVKYGTTATTVYRDTLNNITSRVATLTLNQDGSYTVQATDTGVYEFNIPVYMNDGVPVYAPLKVTVIDANTDINPIIANDDVMYMVGGATPSTLPINVLANDAAGNSTRPLTLTNARTNSGATATVSNGKINYTPAPGFVGIDTVYYTVRDNTPNGIKIDSAKAIIYVYDSTSASTNNINLTVASDDYIEAKFNMITNVNAANGLLANDTLIGSGNLEVKNPGTYDIDAADPSVGTITIASDGSYTVNPGTGMIASKSYPIVYDLGVANNSSVLASGTLYVMGLFNDPLPIRLVDFGAKMIDCNTANVNWETSSESNVSHYEVEYSITGGSFVTVAEVPAKNQAATYEIVVNQEDKLGFYRLKSVDFDGTFAYSKIAQLQMTNCNTVDYTIAPNPSTGKFTVRGEAVQGTIQVMDITGKVMYDAAHESLLQTEIDITAYPTGTYHVRIITENGKVSVFKLIKY